MVSQEFPIFRGALEGGDIEVTPKGGGSDDSLGRRWLVLLVFSAVLAYKPPLDLGQNPINFKDLKTFSCEGPSVALDPSYFRGDF